MRQTFDLEHWAAFQSSFHRLVAVTREVGAGRRGRAPASIVFLGGDVHQGYLHIAEFPAAAGVATPVYQAVCSPFRNPLGPADRALLRAARRSRVLGWAVRRLAGAVGVEDPQIDWHLHQEPTFDNQLATLQLDGQQETLRIECTHPGDGTDLRLETTLERQLA